MTGTDPAVDAAQRAFDHWRSARPPKSAEVISETAARAALAPIRELHKPVSCCPGDACDMLLCSTCHEPAARNIPMRWPCPTARLIYASKELNHDQH